MAFAQFPFSRKPFETFGWEASTQKVSFHLVHPCFTGTKLQVMSWFVMQPITLQSLEGLSQLLEGVCG